MLKLKEPFYSPIEKSMLEFFYKAFYEPILKAAEIPLARFNEASALLAAIRSGRVQYHEGVFSGKFGADISRELSSFARFDSRSNVWRGNPGPDIKGVAVIANAKRKELIGRIQESIDNASATIDQTIATLAFGADLPLFAMDQDIRKDLYDIGIIPELTPATEEYLRENYSESQRLNIKNWAPDQITRLRGMVQKIQTNGDISNIRALILAEWGTTAAKAQFLARQETSLFFSKLGLQRAGDAGVRRYRWSTSHDERVRISHRHLDKAIIHFDFPPIVDSKTGRRAHAGEDFNCRCGKIWILE
jgi:SPP1 gp7 family putative phage head morphogenesis protein